MQDGEESIESSSGCKETIVTHGQRSAGRAGVAELISLWDHVDDAKTWHLRSLTRVRTLCLLGLDIRKG